MCVNECMATKFLTLSAALTLAGALACAQAAELGDAQVRSYIGQPLVADIELTADAGQAVTVQLASADVYRGANTAMHPVLASLTMSVQRRDGRQFLHLASSKPVASDYVHLFLDLAEGNKHNVRAATLWLSPDPNPPPPPPPQPVPVPVPVAPARVVTAPVAAPEEPVRPPKPALVLHLPSAPAACPQKFSDEQIKACSEAEYKNGLLSAQIVELEEKLKTLQLTIDNKAEPAAAKPAKAAKKVTPPLMPPKAPAPAAAGFPWLLVSSIGVLLAALGAGAFFVMSRRKAKSVETAAADSVAWYTRLASRFKRKPKAILITEDEAPAKPE